MAPRCVKNTRTKKATGNRQIRRTDRQTTHRLMMAVKKGTSYKALD